MREEGESLFVLLHSFLACGLWALLHLPETKSSRHTLVIGLVYKKQLPKLTEKKGEKRKEKGKAREGERE